MADTTDDIQSASAAHEAALGDAGISFDDVTEEDDQ